MVFDDVIRNVTDARKSLSMDRSVVQRRAETAMSNRRILHFDAAAVYVEGIVMQ
jgi:hypothetical protein